MTGPRLSIIPARAATDRSLKPRDLQVLCVLGRHTDDMGWCRRSQVKMADEMGCARSTVFEAIERLVKAGYLERHAQESDNGRDSAHCYRVILDPVHPALDTVKPADDPCRHSGTPAGISAPPAGPEPAPPAGPGPAPINDPPLTTPFNEDEREAREGERDGSQPETTESRKAVERAFERAFRAWPTSIGDSRPAALGEWLALAPGERDAAERDAGRYVEAAKAVGRKHVCSFAVYLRERRWQGLPAAEAVTSTLVAAPFGKLWQAVRMAHLMAGPERAPPPLTATERHLVDHGGWSEATLMRDKRRNHGWPNVNRLHELAAAGRDCSIAPRYQRMADLMDKVKVGGALWDAWKGEHERRGWPWMPDPGRQEWVYFPAGGPEGLDDFERAMRANEGTGDDGGRQEAAE